MMEEEEGSVGEGKVSTSLLKSVRLIRIVIISLTITSVGLQCDME